MSINLNDPYEVVKYIKLNNFSCDNRDGKVWDRAFVFDDDETQLIKKIEAAIANSAPISVQDLHDLRVLYYQIVGWNR